MFRVTKLAVLAFTLAVFSLGVAQAADQKHLKRAAEIAAICAKFMPDSQATAAALIEAGFRSEGTQLPWRIFSLDGRRIIAGVSITSARRDGCLVSVSKMTPKEARELIQPWLDLTNAKGIKSKRGTTAWIGEFKGGPVRLGVVDKVNFRIMRGAAIMAIEE